MDSFPFTIFSKYNGMSESTETQQQSYSSPSNFDGSLDSSINRIAKSIANTVIRSSNSNEEETPTVEGIRLPHIPKEVILFGAVITAKVLLFWAYKKARDNGLEIIDL